MKLISINLLRTLAIFLMFITHSIRFLPKSIWSENIVFSFFMKMEPFTSALFLFLVGFSMVLSFEKPESTQNMKKWRWTQIRRSLFLYLIGVSFFITQFGFQIPDVFLSPNILSVIAFSILINLFLLNSTTLSSVFLVLSLFIELALDTVYIGISGVNSGPGGALILICFSVIGQLCAKNKKVEKDVWILSILMFVLAIYQPWTISYPQDYLKPNLFGQGPKHVSFWNHTIFSLLGMNLIFLLISSYIYKVKLTNQFLNKLSYPGVYSLDLYIIHLALIGVFKHFHLIKSINHCSFFIAGLILFSYIYSFLKSYFLKK